MLVYGPEGALLARWGAGGGDGAAGGGVGEFDDPRGVAVDGNGMLYVADTGNDRVVQIAPDGGVRRAWGTRGTADGHFLSPDAVAVDAAGLVYVLEYENNRVQVFDGSGRFIARWGIRGIGLGEFSQPTAIVVDCAGAVYVADTNNNRVQRFQLAQPHGQGCLPAGSWPPPLDVAPVLRVTLPRSGGILARRALALTVSCRRGCRIRATATLGTRARKRGRTRPVKLASVARGLPPALTGHVRLRVRPPSLRTLRRQLGRRSAMLARVQIVAEGPTGRRTTFVHVYRVPALTAPIMRAWLRTATRTATSSPGWSTGASASGSRPSAIASRAC